MNRIMIAGIVNILTTPQNEGIFFHSDFSTNLKININLSRVKASGLSWIPSVTSNVPKNELK